MNPLIIAEVGIVHGGSIERAMDLAAVAKGAGADVVKFQTYQTEKLLHRSDPNYDLLSNLELSFDAFKEIAGHSRVEKVGRYFATTTLERLLQTVKPEIERIDLLSLDVEGHEFNALRSLSLFRWKPAIIISEFSTAGIGEDFRVANFLQTPPLPYELVHQTPANQIFVLR